MKLINFILKFINVNKIVTTQYPLKPKPTYAFTSRSLGFQNNSNAQTAGIEIIIPKLIKNITQYKDNFY